MYNMPINCIRNLGKYIYLNINSSSLIFQINFNISAIFSIHHNTYNTIVHVAEIINLVSCLFFTVVFRQVKLVQQP